MIAVGDHGCGIYKIQSISHPERFYIGSTIDFSKRIAQHRRDLKKQRGHAPQFQHHYNKYGIDDLEFIVIERFEFQGRDYMQERENAYLKPDKPYFNALPEAFSNAGYKVPPEVTARRVESFRKTMETKVKTEEEFLNRSRWQKGKAGKRKGYHNTPEQNRKIGDANRGHISKKTLEASWEVRKNLPHPMLGKHHTEDAKRKMSESKKGTGVGEDNPFYGKHHTQESRDKISKANKGRPQSEETKRKRVESGKRTRELRKQQKMDN